MAILAGDSLLTLAFQVLAAMDSSADRRARMIAELATAAGTVGGMIAGQVADLEGEVQSRRHRAIGPVALNPSRLRPVLRCAPACAPDSYRAGAGEAQDPGEDLLLWPEPIGLGLRKPQQHILDAEASSGGLEQAA